MNERIARVESRARELMDGDWLQPSFKVAHDFKHVDRVRHWALRIADSEGYADLEAVAAAALLHDIGLARVNERGLHAEVGATMAAELLERECLFVEEERKVIAEAIRWHSSVSGGGLLGAILRDADILDLLGAVGVMRAFTSKHMQPEYEPDQPTGETWGLNAASFSERFASGRGIGATIVDQLNFQLSCSDNLATETARRLAAPLAATMRAFVLQLATEITANQVAPISGDSGK